MKDKLFRWAARKLVPAWAQEMEEEGVFRMKASLGSAPVDESEYILVEESSTPADVTVFVFSGLDGLFGGGPRFEFRGMFAKLGRPFNLVFVREVLGYSYHLSPYGTPDGLEFYESRLRAIKERLNTPFNVAMGFSAGGAAAVYFGTRCGMDKVLAFSGAFPTSIYTGRTARWAHYLNLKKLITDPKAYVELTALTWWGHLFEYRLGKVVASEGVWKVADVYRSAESRPKLTSVYGARCRQDSGQAQTLADLPEVKLRPVDTGFHNVPGHLKTKGELGALVLEEIGEVVAAEARELV